MTLLELLKKHPRPWGRSYDCFVCFFDADHENFKMSITEVLNSFDAEAYEMGLEMKSDKQDIEEHRKNPDATIPWEDVKKNLDYSPGQWSVLDIEAIRREARIEAVKKFVYDLQKKSQENDLMIKGDLYVRFDNVKQDCFELIKQLEGENGK